MLNEFKEHLKFISMEIQSAEMSLDHYVGNTPDDAPFAAQVKRLNAIHNDYDTVIAAISTGAITSIGDAIVEVRKIEARYPQP
ncbi:hypothetical protein A6U87_28900 [Rhizobium sp. AC44/96]|uniref:hypothetical protein n=1 Tax=Rhizobium sp. AC44/96 TaxID=1841654 RepID=UPI00082757D0|nr:hypothetical protein [Rhizobium sp. AC44/96]OCJ08579.1 hypothetical protein A6U87_28900 [Rhizobium sp. AC44/96]